MQEYSFTVPAEAAGKRLDVALAEFAAERRLGLSRTFLQQLISRKSVIVDGNPVSKPHYKLKSRERICLSVPEKMPQALEAEKIPLKVLYEDRDLAVIDKPGGLVVHPAPGNRSHTLVNALLYSVKPLSDINPDRPGIVHRLDKETSGVMVVAKTNVAHLDLAKQFAAHTIKRTYIALVKGRVAFNENVIELPIGRHPYKRKRQAVGFDTKTRYARTYYKTLKRMEDASLLELHPFTGRTHQLRVHLSHIGHPVLGDDTYGTNNRFVRMALHAKYLGFIHPTTGKFVDFESPVPKEFTEYMRRP
ncbi:MAG: RluA family pseudouridine synthase [Candidatus Omnitrophica bacterium]|nr:RluA family pseudouridine synthase [Candidatus Omnitrophota bacterium]